MTVHLIEAHHNHRIRIMLREIIYMTSSYVQTTSLLFASIPSPALSEVIVGTNVTAVEGLAIGEVDGPDGALALPMTPLMTLLPVSAMYIVQ